MRTQDRREELSRSAERTAVCPDCGGAMARRGVSPIEWACGQCPETQRIEIMSPEAVERQKGHLHERGTDRLINAITACKEAP